MNTIAVGQSSQILDDSDLPDGWVAVKLPDICELNPPRPNADALAAEAPVTFVPMPAVDAELGAITSAEIRPFANVRKGFTAFREGDVIFAKITPCMENGKSAIAKDLKNGLGFGSTEFHVLRSSDAVIPEFIYYFVRQESYRRAAEAEMTGSVGQKRVPVDFLEETELLLPPLIEQKRIVAKIENLLARAKTSHERLSKTALILKRFRRSVLNAACFGRLTGDWRQRNPTARIKAKVGEGDPPNEFEIPESWNWYLSAHEFTFVTSGSRGWAKYYADGGPIFMRVGNLNHDSIEIDLKHVQHVKPPSNAEGVRTRVRVGDILISITADVGMIALIDNEIGEAYINQHLALARPSEQFDRCYLAYFLAAANGGQRQFQNLQRGATKVGLGLDDIRSIWIARPPIEEQHEIVRRVEALFKLADAIEERVAAATKRTDKLTQAILAKAFRGELVPTEAELARRECREYEPASVLLERIRAERQSDSAVARRGKRRPNRPNEVGHFQK